MTLAPLEKTTLNVTLSCRHRPHVNEVQAHLGGRVIGRLEWDNTTGEIDMVEVGVRFRRQGVATKMLRYAEKIAAESMGRIKSPVHSPLRSPSGDAWARSVSPDLPPPMTDLDLMCMEAYCVDDYLD